MLFFFCQHFFASWWREDALGLNWCYWYRQGVYSLMAVVPPHLTLDQVCCGDFLQTSNSSNVALNCADVSVKTLQMVLLYGSKYDRCKITAKHIYSWMVSSQKCFQNTSSNIMCFLHVDISSQVNTVMEKCKTAEPMWAFCKTEIDAQFMSEILSTLVGYTRHISVRNMWLHCHE